MGKGGVSYTSSSVAADAKKPCRASPVGKYTYAAPLACSIIAPVGVRCAQPHKHARTRLKTLKDAQAYGNEHGASAQQAGVKREWAGGRRRVQRTRSKQLT